MQLTRLKWRPEFVTQFAVGSPMSNAIVSALPSGEVPMTKLRIVSVMALIFAFGGLANADTVKMDGASAGFSDGRAMRGMTQASVESRYGSPVSVTPAVGEPPITRWEYQNFVVFFEYDRVIHAVVKR